MTTDTTSALFYAAHNTGLAGIVVWAPTSVRRGSRSENILDATWLMEQGRGDVKADFGARGGRIYATPRAVLSFEGPESPLVDTELLPQISAPLLWVGGTDDRGPRDPIDRFNLAPAHPLNALIKLKAYHPFIPDKSIEQTIDWLDRLALTLATN